MGLFTDKLLEKKKQKVAELSATGFKSTLRLRVPSCLIAVDENRKEWVALQEDDPMSCKIHKFSDIVDVEIVRNDEVVIKSSTAGAIGKGLVGGALFGVAGAIVGGNSAKQKTETRVTKQGVRIILNTLKEPMIYINCLYLPDKELDQLYSLLVSLAHQE